MRTGSEPPTSASGHGPFVSGVVLGLSLGFATGHLLVFGHSSRERDHVTFEEETQLPPSLPFSTMTASIEAPESQFSTLEFDDTEPVGRVTLSDKKPTAIQPDDGLHFFPESLDRPDEDEGATTQLAFADAGSRLKRLPSQREPIDEPLEVAESQPQAIDPAPTAAPIDKKTSQRETVARAIIREELPDATNEEWDVWYDVLCGLPADDIKGILRMRKHIGSDRSALLDRLTTPSMRPSTPLPSPPSVSRISRKGDTPSSDQPTINAECLAAHNIANRNTPGYKELECVFVEGILGASSEDDVRMTRTIRNMSQGELQLTGRVLDVAIEGAGFLQVRCGNKTLYTRDGRLALDDERRLKLLAPEVNCLIEPPMTVPAGTIALTIETDGRVLTASTHEAEPTEIGRLQLVRFLDASMLATTSDGLYEATPQSGEPHPLTRANIHQRHVERSNSATTYR